MMVVWQVVDNGRRLHLTGAASSAKQYLAGFLGHIRATASRPFQALQGALQPVPAQPTPALSAAAVLQPAMPTPTTPESTHTASTCTRPASGAVQMQPSHKQTPQPLRPASPGQLAAAVPAGAQVSVRAASTQGSAKASVRGAPPQGLSQAASAQPGRPGTAGAAARPASPQDHFQLRAGPSRLHRALDEVRPAVPDAAEGCSQPRVEISITQHAQPGMLLAFASSTCWGGGAWPRPSFTFKASCAAFPQHVACWQGWERTCTQHAQPPQLDGASCLCPGLCYAYTCGDSSGRRSGVDLQGHR